MPTEAEWEYAANVGTGSLFCFGDDVVHLSDYAWYRDTQVSRSSGAQPVGSKKANKWGVHDMHGNVWEWCLDKVREDYEGSSNIDPGGFIDGVSRMRRGGSWYYTGGEVSSKYRYHYGADRRVNDCGFRVCISSAKLKFK